MMSYLKEPLTAGKLYLKNRLVMPPMATFKFESDGSVSRDLLDYYENKSKGGYISLIIVEHSFVSQAGRAGNQQLSIADDAVVDGLHLLSDVIHKNGSKAVIQINHAGSLAPPELTGCDALGPSAVRNPAKSDQAVIPKELDRNEIKRIVSEFKSAAARAKRAGFDGVELHSCHGYLLNQFLSPVTNKRDDDYGGDILNRIRIHIEVIMAIREAVGEDFPILLRMGATDDMEGGISIEDSKAAAAAFEAAGADILDISGGMCRYTLSGNDKPGYFSPYSKAIKEVVSIPVIVTGGVTKAEEAEDILRGKRADLVGVGRAVYKDSGWGKARDGESD